MGCCGRYSTHCTGSSLSIGVSLRMKTTLPSHNQQLAPVFGVNSEEPGAPSQVPQPQRVTRATWETDRDTSGI